jgi:peptide/nickel transport system permease protein
MRQFLLRRLVHAVIVVWGVVTVVFFLVRLTGDPAAFLVDQAATRGGGLMQRRSGLDRRGSSSISIPGRGARSATSTRPSASAACHADGLPAFLAGDRGLAAATIVLPRSPSARHRVGTRKITPPITRRIIAISPIHAPGFWLGLMLILVFAVELGLPAYGSGACAMILPPSRSPPFRQGVRLIRGMLEVLNGTHPHRPRRGARRLVLYRHALKNAALPFGRRGLSLGFMLRRGHHHRDRVRGGPRASGQAASAGFPVIRPGFSSSG